MAKLPPSAKGDDEVPQTGTLRLETQTAEETRFEPDDEPPAPGAQAMDADVILIAHPEHRNLGRHFRIAPGATLEIGRSLDCEASLPDVDSLSRRHALLRHNGSEVLIEDLGSTNGVFVNDKRIQMAEPLKSGDRFQLGSLHFKFLQESDIESAYYNTLYNLAIRDGLTGTFNKRRFEEELEREFRRARRHGRKLALVVLDVDYFKSVNDEHGHLCGDFVLQEISAVIHSFLRREQVFARVGGEEFAILCPETGLVGGVILAERLRAAIAEREIEYGDRKLGVTCSFGVAVFDIRQGDFRELFDEADRALYRAKQLGRDRVSPEPKSPPDSPQDSSSGEA